MLILGTNSIKDTGYNVANSCRFNDDDSPYMHVTRGSAGNQKTFTISMWIKRCELGASNYFFSVGPDGDTNFAMYFNSSDLLEIWQYSSSAYQFRFKPTRVFRDVSAWYHICLAIDTTDATADDRMKIYINGVQETTITTRTNPSENLDTIMNDDRKYWLGNYVGTSNYFDGYIAELVVLDGTAASPTSFGEFDEDSPTVWKPIDVSGLTFGTNGFYLDFEDSSNLGNDANGGTDLTEVNLAATDQATDTPTNNFCTFNNIATTNTIGDDITFSEGNCKLTNTSDGAWHPAIGNIGVTKGKYYAEFKVATLGGASKFGIIDVTQYIERVNFADTSRAYSYEYHEGNAYNNSNYIENWGATFTTNDIISVAMDLDNMHLYFAKNGTWQDSGDPTSGATGTGTHDYFGGASNSANAAGVDTYAFAANIHNSTVTEANFGGCSAFTVSSGNADANGYGNFEYSVPSGYYSLCTKNLAEFG